MAAPQIWGVMFWAIFNDIAYGYDRLDDPPAAIKDSVYSFFQSMRYLLPCHKCRVSYISYLSQLDLVGAIQEQNIVGFVYRLHTLVNTVSKRCQNTQTETDFRRALSVRTSMSSADQVLDMVSIIAINLLYLPPVTLPTLPERIDAFQVLLDVLPSLITLVRGSGFDLLANHISNTRPLPCHPERVLKHIYQLYKKYASATAQTAQPEQAYWARFSRILNPDDVQRIDLTRS